VPLLGYLAISFLYFGRPIAAHPGRYLVGYARDPEIFVWSFAWYLHALETWQNPFVSHAIYAPGGINLAWATTVPGLAFLLAPVTALFGPAAAYNTAAILVPALSAFTAYVLCRAVTRSLWPSLVGGYLFGFSSYMLGQEQGHLHMTSVFLLPLIALVTLRYLRRELSSRGYAWRLGVLFGLQFWLSTEVLVTAAIALAAGLALAFWLVPSTRPRLRAAPRPLLEAIGIALLVAAPLVAFAITGFQSGSINAPPAVFDADLANFVVPTRFVWAGGDLFPGLAAHFRGGQAESGAYLGLPVLLILVLFARRAHRSPAGRYLIAAVLLAALAALGTGLAIRGHIRAWLPWRLVAGLPVLDNVLPTRFSVYTTLAAAVAVALWTAAARGWLRYALPALAVAALVPDLARADYRVHPERWGFFTAKTYKVCFPKGESIAIFPFGAFDDSTLWQAESGFWFRMPEGYLAPTPPRSSYRDPLVRILTDTLENPTPDQIAAFARRQHVDRIVSVDIYVHPNATEMHRFGPVQESGGVLISPACGYPSMQKGIHPTPAHPEHR